ncbi:MAG: nucleotidyl transferase AbiEii/AbiGii toxin family protein [Candidatus Marinimicrobia bacterium]|nr:nucleotidyl transferase AbiEii/AbiGii toxin family protein [Candidatus Neomarinimicrobiota bacterium]
MNSIAKLPIKDRRYIFTKTATHIENISIITEKDFWVVWAMKHIFGLDEISDHFIFRGGTSLSKAHSIIERFSEDVDLGVNYKHFGFTGERDPINAKSKSQRIKLIKQFRREVRHYLENDFKDILTESFGKILGDKHWSLDCQQDRRIIQFYFNYPRSLTQNNYHTGYIAPTVKIEIDPRASNEPFETQNISPIVAEHFPEQFEERSIPVKTLNAERTFWEKVAMLHRIFIGREKLPERFSRHCYDVVQLSKQELIKNTIQNSELFLKVIDHNKKFYEQTDANYLGALDGNLKLVPKENLSGELKNDYWETKNMIFGEEPEFDVLIKELKELEKRINESI